LFTCGWTFSSPMATNTSALNTQHGPRNILWNLLKIYQWISADHCISILLYWPFGSYIVGICFTHKWIMPQKWFVLFLTRAAIRKRLFWVTIKYWMLANKK
jgi:hypothetical protein